MEQRKFCPKCKSLDVKLNITASAVLGVPQNWVCNNCGYTNIIFPELKKLNQKTKGIKSNKQKEKEKDL